MPLFRTRLRVLRAEREWSQAKLAAQVGVTRQTINSIEKGRFHPSRHQVPILPLQWTSEIKIQSGASVLPRRRFLLLPLRTSRLRRRRRGPRNLP